MEEKDIQLKSIFGKWWELGRKWFYPTWLLYELSIRFYDYAKAVLNYFIEYQEYFASYLGVGGSQITAVLCSVATFIICTFFLTVPSCYMLYYFFNRENLTATSFELKLKKYF